MNEEREKPKPLLRDWRVWGLIVTAVAGGLVIGLLVFGSPWHLPPAWGDIPTWLLTVGAFAAAWIALLQLSDLRTQIAEDAGRNRKRDGLLDTQIKEAEQRARILDRQQADMIDLTPGSTGLVVPGLDTAAGGLAWKADVTNRSPRPIRNRQDRGNARRPLQQAVRAGVYSEFPPSPLAPPNAATTRVLDPPQRPDIPLIRAGETGALVFPVSANLNPQARMTVHFTDDAGLRWQIDHDLHLEKLDNRDE